MSGKGFCREQYPPQILSAPNHPEDPCGWAGVGRLAQESAFLKSNKGMDNSLSGKALDSMFWSAFVNLPRL